MSKTAAELLAEANAQIETVSPKVAAEHVAAGDAILLDIREPVEWEHHIGGAIQIPRGTLEWFADPESPRHHPGLDPSREVIVYCRTGGRAALATATLRTLGFEKAVNLEGGFVAWQEAGLPVDEHHDGF